MTCIVQKYGGSSLADVDKLRKIAALIADVKSRPGIRSTRAAKDGGIIGVPSRDLYSVGAGMLDVVQRLRITRQMSIQKSR